MNYEKCQAWLAINETEWVQCGKPALVALRVRVDGQSAVFNACWECWRNSIKRGDNIQVAAPLSSTPPWEQEL